MSTAELLTSLAGCVGHLRLNRPQFHNAVTKRMWEELPGALEGLAADGARTVVVSGQGGSFAAGADLSELESLDSFAAASDQWRAIRDALGFLRRFELPTIAMIDGPCLGGGCLIALSCDLRLASTRAVFAIPVARLGIVLDDENIAWLSSLVGPGFAQEILFAGATIESGRALRMGLVNELFEPDALAQASERLAAQIAENSPLSVAQAKRSIRRWLLGASGQQPQDERTIIESYLSAEFRSRIARIRNRPGIEPGRQTVEGL
ncbi:MAG TPA: enoyl-CoA hydratase-related protein [Candidatus Obscuribacterales bacterium]